MHGNARRRSSKPAFTECDMRCPNAWELTSLSFSNSRDVTAEDKEAMESIAAFTGLLVSERIPPKILHGCVAHAETNAGGGAGPRTQYYLPMHINRGGSFVNNI